MNIDQFGRTIKEKYPQYKDVPDAELGQAMLTKYPQYKSKITSGNVTKTPITSEPKELGGFLQGHPILKKIGDAVGVTGLAKATAQGIFFNFTPEGKDLLKRVADGKIAWSDAEKVLGPFASNKEVLGSAVQTAATIGTAGLGAAKGATAGARIAKSAGALGGVSALGGAAKSYGEDGTAGDIAKSAAISGTTGAVLGAGGAALGELGKLLSSSRVTEGIYNRSLGIPKKVVEKGKSPAKMLINEGISGSKTGILSKSKAIAEKSSSQIDEILKSNKNTFDSAEIIEQMRLRLNEKFQNSLSTKEINTIIDKLPLEALRKNKEVSAQTLNQLRKEIDNNFLGSAKWLNSSTAERINGLKTAANVMRTIVQGSDERLPGIFSKYADSITTIRALDSELAKPHILSNILELIASGSIGAIGGGLSPAGMAGAGATYGAYKTLTSTPVKTGVAKTLSAAGKASQGTVAKTVKGATKVLSQAIAKKAAPKPSKKTK